MVCSLNAHYDEKKMLLTAWHQTTLKTDAMAKTGRIQCA
jgi:hypothetical protein